MIIVESAAKDLQEYYTHLYEGQSNAHKPQYMLVHDELKKCLAECESYTEMGVRQGTTLAIPLLAGTKKVRGYDIDLALYNKVKQHFDGEAKKKGIDFAVIKESTRDCTIDPVDLLYIDTWHVYEQLKIELNRHAAKVKKYIVMHDTYAVQELRKAINEFLALNPQWRLVNECNINVGFSTIKRVSAK